MVIGKPKKITGAVCQNLTQLKFSLQFLREVAVRVVVRASASQSVDLGFIL